jgi:hypothetical protein
MPKNRTAFLLDLIFFGSSNISSKYIKDIDLDSFFKKKSTTLISLVKTCLPL